MIYEKWLLELLFHLLFFVFGICIDMDNEVIEEDDDINLESFGNELDAPPRFRYKNHHIQVEDEEDENKDDDNDASGGAFGSHDIDFNFLHNKWGLGLKLSSCLFETLKLIYYLDVMNLFAICHLDINVMTNEHIYLVLLKVYHVKW